MNYRWPENLRELDNAIERAVVLTQVTTTAMPRIPGATPSLQPMKATSRAAEIRGIPRTIQYRLHDYNAAPRVRKPNGRD